MKHTQPYFGEAFLMQLFNKRPFRRLLKRFHGDKVIIKDEFAEFVMHLQNQADDIWGRLKKPLTS